MLGLAAAAGPGATSRFLLARGLWLVVLVINFLLQWSYSLVLL
ncbi:MAG: hypothetical protein ACRYFK_14170 [Janthinobacterium lividum]